MSCLNTTTCDLGAYISNWNTNRNEKIIFNMCVLRPEGCVVLDSSARLNAWVHTATMVVKELDN